MAKLHILSAGAAQAVVEKVIADFQGTSGHGVHAEFGAVGAMKAKLLNGTPADVLILTAPMIDELIAGAHVIAGSRADLGKVSTGVAVRTGTPLPDVSSRAALRGNLLAASAVACPDPAIATAGKIVMQMMERLGIDEEIGGRMKFFPNGAAAMSWLAASAGHMEMGITQASEILPHAGVTYVGSLPEEFQVRATYSAGLAARAQNPDLASEFIATLTTPATRPLLVAAGYEF
jgi:molybdate transport system substrate-binding protein